MVSSCQGPGRAALQGGSAVPRALLWCPWDDQLTEADTMLLNEQYGRAWQTPRGTLAGCQAASFHSMEESVVWSPGCGVDRAGESCSGVCGSAKCSGLRLYQPQLGVCGACPACPPGAPCLLSEERWKTTKLSRDGRWREGLNRSQKNGLFNEKKKKLKHQLCPIPWTEGHGRLQSMGSQESNTT